MRRIYILLIMAVAMSLAASGQNAVGPLELQFSVGATYPIDSYPGNENLGPQLSLEGRYNFKKVPVDVGVELYLGVALRDYKGDDQSNRIASISVTSDYYFNRGAKVSQFAGLGLGIAQCEVVEGPYGVDGTHFLFTPRVGVEMFHHLRLTLDARIAKKGYSTIGLSIGYALGGGLRK
jgi:hypothetical protein